MAWSDALLRMGYVPAGATPNQMTASGDIVPQQDNSTAANLLRGLEAFQVQQRQKEERKMEKAKNKASMYTTLRNAGYNPKDAYEAVQKDEFPDQPSSGESSADLDLENKKLDNERIQVQTENLREQGKKINRQKLEDKIKDKVAVSGVESLTPGEKQIYDDVIKKKAGIDLGSLLKDAQNNQDDGSGSSNQGSDTVKVISPSGVKGTIPRKNLQKALSQGYKLQ